MASGGHTARCDKALPRPGILKTDLSKPLCWTSETAYLSSPPQNTYTNTVACCPVALSFLSLHTPWTMHAQQGSICTRTHTWRCLPVGGHADDLTYQGRSQPKISPGSAVLDNGVIYHSVH